VTAKTLKTPWGLVVLLGALTALGPLAIDMYLPSLPTIGADLHASAAQTQATVATFLAGMAIGQLFYGPASDRFGRRRPILLGLAIYVAAAAGCAFATSAPVLIGLRLLQALGACAGSVVSRAIVRDRFDHTDTARMLSLMTLIMGLAPIFAPLIGGALLALTGWRSIFGFMSAVGMLVGLAVLLRLKETRSADTAAHARAEHPVRAYLSLLSNRRLVGYAMAAALNGATLFAYVSSSADLLIGAYHIAPSAFGWVFGLNAVAVIGASQVNRRLLRRVTPDQVLERAAYLGVGAALLLALAAASGVGGRWSVLPALFVVLASYGLMQGNTMAGALNIDPRRAGSISALMGAFSFATGAAAAGVVGLLHDGTARPMALVILATMSGSALALRTLALPKKS
jgi:DHA1 family bicyclomycin/chloramphenicol resistance-like MFS transporter